MTEHQIGELFVRYQNYLFTVISNHIFEGCPSDYIYDLLDDTFTIALEKKDDPKFNADPVGWLVTTARFVVDNFNRKTQNRMRFYDSNFAFDMRRIPGPDTMLDDLAFKIAISEQIWDKIYDDLNRNERVFMVMKYYQKKKPAEIAKELHMSENVVKVRLTRLKKKIRKLIHKHIGEN